MHQAAEARAVLGAPGASEVFTPIKRQHAGRTGDARDHAVSVFRTDDGGE
jgi:hypothetical protein